MELKKLPDFSQASAKWKISLAMLSNLLALPGWGGFGGEDLTQLFSKQESIFYFPLTQLSPSGEQLC